MNCDTRHKQGKVGSTSWFDILRSKSPTPSNRAHQKYTIQTFIAKIQTRLKQIQLRRMFVSKVVRTYISTIYPQNVRTRSWPTDDERETRRGSRTARQGAYSVKTKTKPAIIKNPRRKNLAPAVHPLQSSLESTSSDSEHQEASEVGCGPGQRVRQTRLLGKHVSYYCRM